MLFSYVMQLLVWTHSTSVIHIKLFLAVIFQKICEVEVLIQEVLNCNIGVEV